jgi:hypothetical protein
MPPYALINHKCHLSGTDGGLGRRFLPPNFETIEMAALKQKQVVDGLSRTRWPDHAEEASSTLGSCGLDFFCGTDACFHCRRRFRLRLHDQAQTLVPKDHRVLAVQIRPKVSRFGRNELFDFNFEDWKADRQRELGNAIPRDAMFLGGIDLTFESSRNAPDCW